MPGRARFGMTALRAPRAAVPAALLLLVSAFAPAASAVGKNRAPSVRESSSGGIFSVRGTFDVSASSAAVWSVLSDYDHLDKFIQGMKQSAVVAQSSQYVFLQQEAVGRLFFFSRLVHVLLAVKEFPDREIDFEDVSHKDFTVYNGAWTLSPVSGGTEVTYSLTAQMKGFAPCLFCGHAFKANAAKLLEQVQDEIVRRGPLQAAR